MSQHHKKYMEAIEATTVFMEKFSFIHTFIFIQAFKIGPDVSKNGHGVFLEHRIHKGAWKTCPGWSKTKLYSRPIGHCFLLRLHNILNARDFRTLYK